MLRSSTHITVRDTLAHAIEQLDFADRGYVEILSEDGHPVALVMPVGTAETIRELEDDLNAAATCNCSAWAAAADGEDTESVD